jgi:chromosome segregation ATPase
VHVLVPDDWLTPAKENPPDTATAPTTSREDTGMMAALLARAERAEERVDEANMRADVAVSLADRTLAQLAEERDRADELRAEITAFEAKLVASEAAAKATEARADALRADMLTIGAKLTQTEQGRAEADERATDAIDRAAGLDNLLADAERRLVESDAARRATQERLDTMDRADGARRGKGRWARLRAAWRGV